ncbi:MAG: radical SAM/SPASM domain-containing protein [Thermaurantimonas sp.]
MRKLKNLISRNAPSDSGIWPVMRSASSVLFYYRYYRHQVLGNPLRNFRELYIEPVGYCNLRCRWCALDHLKPKSRFDVSVFQDVVNEIIRDQRLRSIQWIHLHNGGESTLHPHLEDMLKIVFLAKKKASDRGHAFPKVSLLSNGTVFRPGLATAMKNYPALDLLRFSMDGGSPQAYEEIRNRARWGVFRETVIKYIEAARASEKPPQIECICLIPDDLKPRDVQRNPEFSEMLRLFDDFEVRYAHDWGGQLSESEKALPSTLPLHRRGCRLLLNSLVLLADGSVTVCCADLNGRGVIGSYPETSLANLFLHADRNGMLEKIARGRNADIPLCASCEGF